MNLENYKTALTYLQLKNKKNLIAYLDSSGATLLDFGYMLYDKGRIDDVGFKKLTGHDVKDREKESHFQDFISRLNSNQLSYEELQTKYSEERYNMAISEFVKSKLQNNSLSENELFEFVKRGILSENIVRQHLRTRGRSEAEIDEILGKEAPQVIIPKSLWPTEPNLTHGNTDVLLVGSPGSGKTMFLASLYYYGENEIGTLNKDANNNKGYAYSSLLVSTVQQGLFVNNTPPEFILHTTAVLSESITTKNMLGRRKTKTVECPFNFIEMAGETFSDAFGKKMEDFPENLRHCFKVSQNPKIILLIVSLIEEYVSVKIDGAIMKLKASELHNYILDFIKAQGLLDKVVSIGLIITKWDLAEDQSDDGFNNLINTKYKKFEELLKSFKNEFGIPYDIFSFSIGDVDDKRKRYTYSDKGISDVYEWILHYGPIRPN